MDEETGTAGIIKTYATRELEVEIQEWDAAKIEDLATRIEAAFVRLNELLLDLVNPTPRGGVGPPAWLDKRNWSGSG